MECQEFSTCGQAVALGNVGSQRQDSMGSHFPVYLLRDNQGAEW